MEKMRERWGEVADVVIAECHKVDFGDNFDAFLDHCLMQGGNWVGMILTGIKELFPDVYAALPDELGATGFESFENLICVLQLCGVNTAE